MRHGNDTWWNYSEKGFCAVSLGAEYCAEHEWGIKGLRRLFGMDDSLIGIDKRIVRTVPKELQWIDQDKFSGIYCSDPDNLSYVLKDIRFFDKNNLCTMWDEKAFAIFSDNKEKIGNLKKIYEAFQEKNIAMWVGGGSIFQNGGLILAIVDKLPEDKIQLLKDSDQEKLDLAAAMQKTGIADKLRAANKRYFALSPRWKDDKKKELIFWLNPMEQQQNNYGWYSLKDLDDWIKGKGPIPMKKK